MPQHAPVDWSTLIYVVSAVAAIAIAIGGFVGWAVWWITHQLAQNRHDMRSHVEQVLAAMSDDIEEQSKRISAVEVFNAGLTVMLKQVDEFRSDVKQRFESLHQERKGDMKDLHKRLDEIRAAQP
jgi:predicted nuclease with TOPRIM domain